MANEQYNSFDEIKERLDEIVSLVSDDSLSLEEALDLYDEAVGIGFQASHIMEEGIADKASLQNEEASSNLTSDSDSIVH